jgi:hypothetical protein
MCRETGYPEYPVLYCDLDTIIEKVKNFKSSNKCILKDIKQIYNYDNHYWKECPKYNDKIVYCYEYYFEFDYNGLKMINKSF